LQGIEIPSVSPAQALAEEYTIVDVRSPAEFAQGHVPDSLNLPLLDDSQRAAVGLTYHREGAQAARLLAMDLLTPGLPSYLRRLRLAASGRRLAVMCWRGGERSRNVVLLLGLIGLRAVRMEGGYKAYRRLVRGELERWQPDRPVVTLYGYKGAGKTGLLRRLAARQRGSDPRPAVIDLEGLALHRGSLLGGLNQPARRTQKDFESLLWDALRNAVGDYLVFEGEGTRIGHLLLPESVARAVRGGAPVLVHSPVARRTATILQDYAPGSWSSGDARGFEQALESIARRLPAGSYARLMEKFASGRYSEVVEELLVTYYDPLYLHSSVQGKEFVLTLSRTADEERDAERLARELPLALDRVRVGQVRLTARDTSGLGCPGDGVACSR
jgi:tRNA 2-selenouridine synthase